jgi:predicted transcriptional regulator of viral defense system
MKFADLVTLLRSQPVFEAGLLMAGDVDPGYLRRQVSEWVAKGRLIRLRKGLYVLGPGYRAVEPHPFLLANRIRPGSVVSLQSVLAEEDLIPEYVPAVTSVWSGRPGEVRNPLGRFIYRHLAPRLLFGYRRVALAAAQEGWVATGEKALLDLVHLTPGADRPAFLDGLRLQNLEALSRARLLDYAGRFGRPKLERAVRSIIERLMAGEEPG